MLAAALPLGAHAYRLKPHKKDAFSFVLLGDLHYDKVEHHDWDYIKASYPHDVEQIHNYSRITRDNLPLLMKEVKEKANNMQADFYLQLGDFVEGLAGSAARAQQQVNDFIGFMEAQELNKPFFVVKGNHDITGAGAAETYKNTVLPWQSGIMHKELSSANVTFVHNNARFVIFDCFAAATSLEWLKGVLAEHKEELLFFCVHYPIVPFNARANWHVFAKPQEAPLRKELMTLLGKHRAIILCGHLHKTSVLTRSTAAGNFVQISFASVIPAVDAPVKDHLRGIASYNADLLQLEPDFAPASLEERKRILEKEAPFIKHYEYADFCGHATVNVRNAKEVQFALYANADKAPWLTVNLNDLF